MAWVIEPEVARTFSSSKIDRSRGLPTQARLDVAERIDDWIDEMVRAIGVLAAGHLA